MIFGFFAKSPEKETRELARDVKNIIATAEETYRPELLDEIASITRAAIQHLIDRCGDDSKCRALELSRYTALHRDARRRNSQVGLTAYTLVIINSRAAAFGDLGAPVCAEIEQFLSRWPAKTDPQEDTLIG